MTAILFDNSMTWLIFDYCVVALLEEHTIDNNLACSVYWWTCCILYKVTVILFDNSMAWLTYDYRVVTLLAEHTIDNKLACLVYWWTCCNFACRAYYSLPGRRPHINFCVSVLHLKNIHTIVSSLQNLFGNTIFATTSFQFVSWWVQAQEPLGQSEGSVKVSWEWEKA